MTPASLRTGAGSLVVCAAAALGISMTQPDLARVVHGIKARDDVFLIPPPKELKLSALGYDAALADIVWAKLLLEYGRHWMERRYFRDARRFIDGIIELDPSFRAIYSYVEVFLIYQPTNTNFSTGSEKDARDARAYLERGTRERPRDAELWLHYGQFIAFSAPAYLDDLQERERWRTEGALALAHALDVGAKPGQTAAAASILGRRGEREAAVRYLERAYALTDDEDERRQIQRQLAAYARRSFEDAVNDTTLRLERSWRATFPFVTRTAFTLLGPVTDAAACAGLEGHRRPGCARNWSTELAPPEHTASP